MKINREIFHSDATINTYLDFTVTTCFSDCSKNCTSRNMLFLQNHLIGFNLDKDVSVPTTGFYSDTTVQGSFHYPFYVRNGKSTELIVLIIHLFIHFL